MFKEKDKRIILLIVFGAAIVSFITATIAGIVNSLTIFCDSDRLYGIGNYSINFYYAVSSVLLVLCVLCLAYFFVKLFVRKNFIPSLVIGAVIVCYVVASAIALRYSIPTSYKEYFSESGYSFFQTSYVATAVTIAITVTLAEASHLLIIRMDRKKAEENAQKEEIQVAPTEE